MAEADVSPPTETDTPPLPTITLVPGAIVLESTGVIPNCVKLLLLTTPLPELI